MAAHPGNKYAEKWTERRALAMGTRLLNWFKSNDTNVFYGEFLVINEDMHRDHIAQLSKKFPKFLELIKRCEAIKESRLARLTFERPKKYSSAMAIFVLKNHHGYTDKIDHTTAGEQIDAIKVRVWRSGDTPTPDGNDGQDITDLGDDAFV